MSGDLFGLPAEHVVLFSGGLDSFITLKYVMKEATNTPDVITPVYCKLGHRYEEKELGAISRLSEGLVNFDNTLKGLGNLEGDDAYIPERNAHLVIAALKYSYGIYPLNVWLTVQQDEMSLPDRSEAFLKSMSKTASVLLGRRCKVVTPWEAKDKVDMVRWYLESGYSESELLSTWSCYFPRTLAGHCGNCSACFRRYVALKLNGVSEVYGVDPRHTSIAGMYLKRALDGQFSEKRTKRIMEALNA